MIPDVWYEERAALAATRSRQSQKGYVPAPDEVIVLQADIDALDQLPITAPELATLAGRGEYRTEDTRGFVLEQEQRCALWNCWMVRDANGSCRYVSEARV